MLRNVAWTAATVAVLIGLSSCADPSMPPGTSADVVVRAYVDVGGTGSFSSGDPAISGSTITLRSTADGTTRSATTGGDGQALFEAVPPGSYVASLEGPVPAGAAISGPERPVVVVPFQGGTLDIEFRYVFFPGTLTGVVFRDDDESGGYNADTDATAAGAEILVYWGTTATGDPVATATTGSDGTFTIAPLRAGTHAVLLRVPEPIEVVGDSVRLVEVPAQGTAAIELEFAGDMTIAIADARAAAPGTTVTVEGVVLADQGTYQFQGRDTYIQDSTGGIRLWDLDTGLGLEVGDSVQAIGTIAVVNDETQITVSELEVLGTGVVPAPRAVTGAEINSFEFDGRLGITGAVTVTEVDVHNFDAHTVRVVDAAGTEFDIRVESENDIPSGYWEVGESYRVTGVVARFRADGQIKPRGFQDVLEVTDLADIRAGGAGARVLFEGVVLADQGTYDFGNRDTYVQDATAGIRLWALDTGLGLEAGDSLRVWGSTSVFNNELQVDVDGVQRLGTGTIPDPRAVTGSEINSFEFDGQLAVTGAVTVTEVDVFNFGDHNVTVEDEDGTEFVVRVESPNDIPSDYWEVGESYRITGVLARFRADGQIKPRGFDDVEEL